MTLDDLFLEKIAEWRPDNARETLEVVDPASGWTAVLVAECNDQVGTRAWELTLNRPTPVADLRAWADRAAAQVAGLLEPLKLLEVDVGQDTALLRSEAPRKRGEVLHYYEVLLKGKGEAVVRRFQAVRDGSKRREQESFALTHEALAKLIGDLAATA
jgi:hypothetical protein